MPQIDIDQDTLDAIIEIVYKRWTEEFDLMKKVKEERNDGSSDWQEFHDIRMKNHAKTLETWNNRRLKLSPLHSLVNMR